ncbi:Gfo/Idh/MocA family protein [Micromonospora cathayae]|uniref:Gfo/Idh/MocA family oxidoreductase n=1 Tax=Micromonospora cathayae TaxID=3028804 RepID=A0ABY7ZI49_9ACTN|nr:Gfo/Idh/MocA family oxidoreductase [Micromonospora sp. HUAS 3]WDZ82654.1 Gfo/Idh/MocA family oxidoreductase [Micromonospora sp. HUAS 3]
MTDRPVRAVVLGCGDIAATGHLPAVARSADVTLVGVLDSSAERRRAASAAYRVPELPDLAAAVRAGADVAVVATPPEVSPHLTMAAVAAGLDVLCEKPMAVDLGTAERVRTAVAATDRIVQIGFKNRFSPLVRALRRWVRAGRLGAPVVYTLGGFDERYDPADTVHTGRIAHFLAHGPSFVHEGAHFADYLAYVTGARPVDVRASGVRSRPDLPAENFVSALVRYDNGDLARLEIGWQFPVSPRGEFRALGPDGVVLLDRPGGVATLHTADGTEQVRLDRPWNDLCFDAQLAHFVDCVRRRATPETSVEAGLASLRLGLAVAEATATGAVVPG